ncbi:glycerol-3-phosphate 1-O-acyltransferase PlsY [Hyphomicrobium zavarzinii]|uniref:glycerol-3-phosphate 1-O-acyltransferase PlsY n=1 Tax=Hyphomicrobium zavarzinii TaxID=48292 RepID=UPI002353D47D|nr:glycerol-3-phosphate 1-O-acyltransferase PlsY [Hyphomicrobium zavarzinii]
MLRHVGVLSFGSALLACLVMAAPAAFAGGAGGNTVLIPPPLSTTETATAYLLPAIVGYLLGSIPFGLLLTRLAGLGDIRSIGSGNIGATNVLRTGNKGLAALTLLLDALKGTAAVLLGYRLGARFGLAIDGALLAGLAAFLGHLFPVWLGFKGGKGVATYIGVVGGLLWPGALIFCAIWLLTAFTTRYSSLSALAASVITPLALFALGHVPEALLALPMSLLLIWKHSANISRLLKGEEPKIGAKA